MIHPFFIAKNARRAGAIDESVIVISEVTFFIVAFAVLGSVWFAIQSEGKPSETDGRNERL
jgi:hypothetical protein